MKWSNKCLGLGKIDTFSKLFVKKQRCFQIPKLPLLPPLIDIVVEHRSFVNSAFALYCGNVKVVN